MLVRHLSSSLFFVFVSAVLLGQIAKADCSASIASFSLAGHGASGHESTYVVKLDAGADVDIADFIIESTEPHASHKAVWLEHDAPTSSLTTSISESASAWLALPTSLTPSAIALASITMHGQSAPCVPQGSLPIRLTSVEGETTIYDDSHPHSDLGEALGTNDVVARDADFSRKAEPDYPERAMEEGIMADVAVEVGVGPTGGRPASAWVRWTDTHGTGDGSVLADAALAAARASTFTAPMRDGRSQSRSYKIIYTFSLAGSDGPPPPNPPTLPLASVDSFNDCPLEIDDSRVVSPTASDPAAWYFFRAYSQFGAVSSAVVAVEDQRGHVTAYPWPAISLYGPTGDEKYPGASGILEATGPDVRAMWVEQATLSGGMTVNCTPDIDEPLPVNDGLPTRRLATGAANVSGVEEAPPARYSHEVLPLYPTEADGKRAAGHVTIDGIVDSAGRVVEAFVTSSSDLDDLDKAAMDAATASTYGPAAKGSFVAFETTYRFMP